MCTVITQNQSPPKSIGYLSHVPLNETKCVTSRQMPGLQWPLANIAAKTHLFLAQLFLGAVQVEFQDVPKKHTERVQR